jgi:hypothetical protein
MYKKYYTIEWMFDLDDRCYSGRKRFEADEGAEMVQFVFDLAHKEGIFKIWKNTFEEITF